MVDGEKPSEGRKRKRPTNVGGRVGLIKEEATYFGDG